MNTLPDGFEISERDHAVFEQIMLTATGQYPGMVLGIIPARSKLTGKPLALLSRAMPQVHNASGQLAVEPLAVLLTEDLMAEIELPRGSTMEHVPRDPESQAAFKAQFFKGLVPPEGADAASLVEAALQDGNRPVPELDPDKPSALSPAAAWPFKTDKAH